MMRIIAALLAFCCGTANGSLHEKRRLTFASVQPGDPSDAPASFWPTPVEDEGPCESPYDELSAERLASAKAFLDVPFLLDGWVADHGRAYALERLEGELANITTPNVTQTVYETGSWTGTKFTEYQFLSSAEFNGGILTYTKRECDGQCDFVSHRVLDARVSVSFEHGDNPVVGGPQGDGGEDEVERSVIVYESCSPRIEHIYTDLAKNFVLSPEDHFNLFANNERNVLALCAGHMIYCRGPLAEYADISDCVDKLTQKPGVCYDFYLKGDTIDCRSLHLLNARVFPEVHCPHLAVDSPPCGMKDCPSEYCGYVNTRVAPAVINPAEWATAGCDSPVPPVSDDPIDCIETCEDDALGMLASNGQTCGPHLTSLCDQPIATLAPDTDVPADVTLGEICPVSCELCTARCS